MNIKAIAFDTGGTVLDWHSGIRDAFAAIGAKHGEARDWTSMIGPQATPKNNAA